MARRPATATPATTVQQAVTSMRRGHFRHLPVVAGGRLLGILSDRDLQRAIAAGTSEHASVGPLAHTSPITATADTPIERVAKLMQDNKIGCVPIVSTVAGAEPGSPLHDELVGIVTGSDIFAALARTLSAPGPGSRLTIRLGDPAADLEQVAGVLKIHHVPIHSLATEPVPESAAVGIYQDGEAGGDDAPALRLILRLGTINPGPIADALRQAGLHVESGPGDGAGTLAPPSAPEAPGIRRFGGTLPPSNAHRPPNHGAVRSPRPGVSISFEVER